MRLEDLHDPDDFCRGCGTRLPADRRPYRRYCTRACRLRHDGRLDAEARREARTGLTCRECGTTFAGARAGQLYCSKACARIAMRKTTWGYRTCRICDRTFLPNHKGQFMCVEPHRVMECVERLRARLRPAPAREG